MKAKTNRALNRYYQVLSSIRKILKAQDEREKRTVDTITKLCLLYEKCGKMAAPAQMADVLELWRRVTILKGVLEKKKRQLQKLPSLAEKNAVL